MELQKIQLEELNEKTKKKYAKWLLDGFRDWSNAAYRSQAFRPIHYALSPSELLTEQLADIYGILSREGRENLSLGLAQAICECPRRPEWTDTLSELVHLGVAIRAVPILDAIKPLLLQNGYLSRALDPMSRRAYATVVNFLTIWDGEPKLIPLWERLLNNPSLPLDDAPALFIALCRAKPEQFPEYLKMAGKHFDLLKGRRMFPRGMIAGFVGVVDAEVIANHAYRLRLSPLNNEDYKVCDNWFLEALTAEQWSYYRIRNELNNYSLVQQENYFDTCYHVKPPDIEHDNFYYVLQRLSNKSVRRSQPVIKNHFGQKNPYMNEKTRQGVVSLIKNCAPEI